MKKQGYLGIDIGTQGLSVIFTDEAMRILSTGNGDYSMVPGLPAECQEQRPADWEQALAAAMGDLRRKLGSLEIDMEVRAIGISGQMHGEVLVGSAGVPLAPARLWCDGRNEAEGHELTTVFDTKVPKRMTAARWLWTIRHQSEKASRVVRITTPAGWIAHVLTGGFTLGIGDAAGMFPIDQATLDYDAKRLADFDAVMARTSKAAVVKPLRDLLPEVRRAGEDGGVLDARGAALLGLPQGIPVAPAEGDQPAALAGSLIAEAGTVSMSFGTSVVANSVGDRAFKGVDRAIDHFCAPDGKPINMVWLRNGTTAMNAVVEMFGKTTGRGLGDAFALVIPLLLAAPDDCGGLQALPFMDDEPGAGVSRGGTSLVIGLNEQSATPGNVARAMLLATIFNLRMGSEGLDAQSFPRKEIVLSGGITKTPELAQLIADAFHVPVVILAGAVEGTAWGAALMAKFRDERLLGKRSDWQSFLAGHATEAARRFEPRSSAATTYDRMYARHKRLVAIHGQLDAAVVAG
ncbi:MAG: FGGY-family carbohydrate kinase [Planctomycetes bacterium]|nr:FGGY-family carbohydrate kinase [Planctomycetota bacterium]